MDLKIQDKLNAVTFGYVKLVIGYLEKRYGLCEAEAIEAVNMSLLSEDILSYPELVLHDPLEVTAEDVYREYAENRLLE